MLEDVLVITRQFVNTMIVGDRPDIYRRSRPPVLREVLREGFYLFLFFISKVY